MKEAKLFSKLAMIAFFRLFKHVKIGSQFLFCAPGCPIDALQHWPVRIAPPIRTCNTHQFKGMTQTAGRRQMRSPAQINKVALSIKRHRLVSWNCLDKLNFERLIIVPIEGHCLISCPDLTDDHLITVNNFMHSGFNSLEVRISERCLAMKIVIEPVLNRWADGYLGFWIDFKNSLCHNMRAIMTQKRKRAVILDSYQCQ